MGSSQGTVTDKPHSDPSFVPTMQRKKLRLSLLHEVKESARVPTKARDTAVGERGAYHRQAKGMHQGIRASVVTIPGDTYIVLDMCQALL